MLDLIPTIPLFTLICFLVAFAIGSCTDIKKREIPIWLFPAAAFLSVAVQIPKIDLVDKLQGLLAASVISLLSVAIGWAMTRKVAMGGGDVIMFAFVGLGTGMMFSQWFLAITVLAAMAFFVVKWVLLWLRSRKGSKKNVDWSVPVAPFAAIGFLVTYALSYAI